MNDQTKLMINKAYQALNNAYAPYSNYKVGCCLVTKDDEVFAGTNVENSSYGLTICAEISAIAHMVAAGKRQIKSLVIIAGDNEICPPCGACRQCIHEFSTSETLVHLCNKDTILKTMTINDLLPMAFNLKG